MNPFLKPIMCAAVAVAALTLPLVGCSQDDDAASTSSTATSTSTTAAGTGSGSRSPDTTGKGVGGNVLPPTMLDTTTTSATVKVGATVVFNLGDPSPAKYVATSDAPEVVKITSTGGNQGTYTSNAGGTAVAKGTATVTVRLDGTSADNALPAETVFTITVG